MNQYVSDGLAVLTPILVIGVIMWLIRRHDATVVGPWDIFAVCKCGWWTRAPMGSIFFVRQEVCPDCGEAKDSAMHLETRRWNGPLNEWEKKA